MMCVLSRQNLNEIEDIVRFAADLGFRQMSVFDLVPIDDAAALLSPSRADLSEVDERALDRLGRRIGLDVAFDWIRRRRLPPKSIVRCVQPWEYMQVRVGGDVVPCCVPFGTDKLQVMGNLLHQEFDEIWHGKSFREFRQTSASGRNPLCTVCTYY
jgi:radical SAM protein with 4Fe4S-binding SPASM domain